MKRDILYIIFIIILIGYFNFKIEKCKIDNIRYDSKIALISYVVIKNRLNDINSSKVNYAIYPIISNAIANLRFLDNKNMDIGYICEFIEYKDLKNIIFKELRDNNETNLVIKINDICINKNEKE